MNNGPGRGDGFSCNGPVSSADQQGSGERDPGVAFLPSVAERVAAYTPEAEGQQTSVEAAVRLAVERTMPTQ
jgi:hypothetical protein